MKVLLVVHHFPPRFAGGSEWKAYRTARGLQERAVDVRVFCVESLAKRKVAHIGLADELYDGIPVRRLSLTQPQADRLRFEFRNPLVERAFRSQIAEWQPEIVYLISGYLVSGSVIDAARSLSIPIVLAPVDFWFACPRITLLQPTGTICNKHDDTEACSLCLAHERRRYRLLNRLSLGQSEHMLRKLWRSPAIAWAMGQQPVLTALRERQRYLRDMYASADLVISESHFLVELLSQQGLLTRRVAHLRQGVDPHLLGNGKVPSTNLRIGYIGQIAPHKGVDVLVKAFRGLRPAPGKQAPHLAIYGNLTQFPRFVHRLRALAANDPHIAFKGSFDHRQVAMVHREIDVLVVPSVWYENSPNAVLEALATHTPVVASNWGGLPELVQHEQNGLLFRVGDVDDLRSQLQRIVDDPDVLNTLRAGMQPVKTIQEEIDELIALFESVLLVRAA